MLPKLKDKLSAIWKKGATLDIGGGRPALFRYSVFNEASCCTRMLNFSNGESGLELDRWSLATYPKQANVLIVCGHVSKKAESIVCGLRAQLLPPRFIIFLGSCGAPQKLHIFSENDASEPEEAILYVPGCPVNPGDVNAAILNFVEKTYAK